VSVIDDPLVKIYNGMYRNRRPAMIARRAWAQLDSSALGAISAKGRTALLVRRA
jgi:hypothetical protein